MTIRARTRSIWRSVQKTRESAEERFIRNLNILSEEGQITHVKVPGADRYDCRTDFHYHLICTGCGAVCDAPFSYDPTPDKTLAAESGYRITRHRLIFEGICPACQKAGREK